MIDLRVKKGKLELLDYSGDTTLAGLLEAIEAFAGTQKKQTVQCRMCGECCAFAPVLGPDIARMAAKEGVSAREWAGANLILPDAPDMAERRKGIAELKAQTGVSERDAAVLYEFNRAEPFIFRHGENGRCFHQKDNRCGIYPDRLFVCRLYLCRFGDRLQDLEEMIVTQGTWHAWALLGAVPEEEMPHNPFVGKDSYGDVLLGDFEFKLDGAAGELFSYF